MANEAESMANEVVSKDMQNPLNANEAVTNCYWHHLGLMRQV